MATEQKKSVFQTLNDINVNGHTEVLKQGNSSLTYLSWAWAWSEVKKLYPDASYTIYKDENNRPFIEDPDFGLMCYTTVTIDGLTHEMWLPVLNGANKSMRRKPYTYQVKDYNTKQMVDKTVEAATMFDINKTIMRCLVKNLAMFGLGLYIYAGEDLPEEEVQAAAKAADAELDKIIDEIKAAKSRDELNAIWKQHPDLQANTKFTSAFKEAAIKYPKPQNVAQ